MLKLYFCRLPDEEISLPEDLLSGYRRGKLARLKNPVLRKRALCSELLLRYALRDRGFELSGPLALAVGDYGKPYLTDHSCCFSLSDSGSALLCALSDREIGADLQQLTPVNVPLMRRFYTEDEQKYVLFSADRDAAFTEIWTKKESYCKASGKGLSLPLASFSVMDGRIADRILCGRVGEYTVSAYMAQGELPETLPLEQIESSALLV